MSILNSSIVPASAGGYEIDNSLRFNDDDTAYLSRTPSSAGNRRTWTWSGWVKRGNLGNHAPLFCTGENKATFRWNDSTDVLRVNDFNGDYNLITNQVFRDTGAWMHIVVVMDTTQSTASNRLKLYINGLQVTGFSTEIYPSLNLDTQYNLAQAHYIGTRPRPSPYGFDQKLDGYLAEVNFVDGQALTPDNFGETGDYGEWKPIEYAGTYGTNGFYLDFEKIGGEEQTAHRYWKYESYSSTDHHPRCSRIYLIKEDGTKTNFKYYTTDNCSDSGSIMATTLGGTYSDDSNTEYTLDLGTAQKPRGWGLYVTYGGGNRNITARLHYSDDNTNWTQVEEQYTITDDGCGEYNRFIGGGLGKDTSGNGNNWTPNNLAATDQMLDSPTNNFCTWNVLDKGSSYTLSEGNLKGIATSDWFAVKGTQSTTSGKRYFEIQLNTSAGISDQMAGLCGEDTKVSGSSPLAQDDPPIVLYHFGGLVTKNGTNVQTGLTAMTVGAVLGVAVDFDASTVQFYVNNVAQGVAESLPTTAIMLPIHVGANGRTVTANFGQDSSFAGNKTAQGNTDGNGIGDFYYTPPTGYLALCTSNLPAVSVVPSEHFNTVLYTGNGSTQSITGVGFQPDLTWIKERSDTSSHQIFNSISGAGNGLHTNTTSAEFSDSQTLSSFESDGFNVGTSTGINHSGQTNVAWNWKANGSGSSNTDGTITSTVSANADAGFSIVSYTGTGSSATVGHGLSKTPEIIILKDRDTARNWGVYGSDFYKLRFNSDHGDFGSSAQDVTSNSSALTINTDGDVNISGDDYIAYCFHSVEGYSKVSSYEGTANTDGPFIYTGFRPAYVLVKRVDGVRNWLIFDSKRGNYNPIDQRLYADHSTGENYGDSVDFTSNGFKVITNSTNVNYSGDTYLYLAFAETPFKYSNAR